MEETGGGEQRLGRSSFGWTLARRKDIAERSRDERRGRGRLRACGSKAMDAVEKLRASTVASMVGGRAGRARRRDAAGGSGELEGRRHAWRKRSPGAELRKEGEGRSQGARRCEIRAAEGGGGGAR